MKRQEYIGKAYENKEEAQIDHRKYYGQFVLPIHKREAKELLKRYKHVEWDEHLNNIPLSSWDSMRKMHPPETFAALKEAGDFMTLAGSCCIFKEAARQVIESGEI